MLTTPLWVALAGGHGAAQPQCLGHGPRGVSAPSSDTTIHSQRAICNASLHHFRCNRYSQEQVRNRDYDERSVIGQYKRCRNLFYDLAGGAAGEILSEIKI
ncbi:hypothetical protein EVAR_27590_1 [Eumeta japonica]|uniref:Uncharacterized protein n=1 Tax=Eumeta variegata TaxID=151549 RepID=A0A4C1WAX6_EUMVA|nr:hypothetical protein EVAR_27590_1 [Eumeta japonica]